MQSARRIVFDARNSHSGDACNSGAARYAFHLLDALTVAAPQHSFVVVCGSHPDPQCDWGSLRARPNVELVDEELWPLSRPHGQLQWPSFLRRVGADLFHTPSYVAPLLSRVPAVVTVHHLASDHQPASLYEKGRSRYSQWLMARSIRHARRVIAPSWATAGELSRRYGRALEKVAVVYPAPDQSLHCSNGAALEEVRRRYDLGRPFILSIGERRPEQNGQRLVQAFAALADLVPHDLVLLGATDERCLAEARRAAAQHQLNGRVRFLGEVNGDRGALYELADVLAAPSLFDGDGAPVLAAMACGTPVLASAASSWPEVVGDAGLLVDATDERALSRKLHALLQDRSLRQRLGRAARARAATFNWDRAAHEVVALYMGIWGLGVGGEDDLREQTAGVRGTADGSKAGGALGLRQRRGEPTEMTPALLEPLVWEYARG